MNRWCVSLVTAYLLTAVDLVKGGLMASIYSAAKDKEVHAAFMSQYWLEVLLVLVILHAIPVTWLFFKRKEKLKRLGFFISLLLMYVALVVLVTIFPGLGILLKKLIFPLLVPAPPPPGGI